jgi:DNA-binding phage protein
MLSWSSNEMGDTVDLTAVAEGRDGVGIDHDGPLVRFATACAERDDAALAAARQALIDDTDEAFMVDAAGVAANFEMMTRLADATGATMPPERVERAAATIGALGIAHLTSRR